MGDARKDELEDIAQMADAWGELALAQGHEERMKDMAKIADTLRELSEERDALRKALSCTVRADNLREAYHALPNERQAIGRKRSRKGHARDAWLRAFRKAAKNARAAIGNCHE